MRYFIFLFFLTFTIELSAYQTQMTKADSVEVEIATWQYERGYTLFREKPDSCRYYLEKAGKVFLKHKIWNKYLLSTIFYNGVYYKHTREYDSAIYYLKKAKVFAEEKLDPTDPTIVKILNRISQCYDDKRDHPTALKYCMEAMSYYTKVGDCIDIAFSFNHAGFLYRDYYYYDLDKALDYFNKSHIMYKRAGVEEKDLAANYDHFGNVWFKMGEYNKSKEAYKTCIKLYENSNSAWRFVYIVESYFYLGEIAIQEQDYDQALWYFNKALRMGKEKKNAIIGVKGGFQLLYAGIGNLYLKLKKYDQASFYYLKSLSVPKNKNNYYSTSRIGEYYLTIGKYDSALMYIQRGIINVVPGFKNKNIYKNPQLDNTTHKSVLFQLLNDKSKALFMKYRLEKVQKEENLAAAIETNELTFKLVDSILHNFESTGSKLVWSDRLVNAYELSMFINKTLYSIHGKERYKDKIFEIAEKNKASVLLSELRTIGARYNVNMPDSLIDKERNIRSELVFYKNKLNSEKVKKNSVEFNFATDKIFALNREKEDLEKLFEKEYPKYHQLKFNQKPYSVKDVQAALDPTTTLIEYFIGDSAIHAFTITKDKYDYKELPKIDSLEQKVKSLPSYLKVKDKESFSKASYKLYQQLFAPLDIQNSNLIIIPDGALWQLNFDLLLSKIPEKLDYRKFQYLIKDYTINYAYSAKLIKQDQDQRVNKVKNECLAFSFNNADDIQVGNYISMRGFRDGKADLPGTRTEIKAVSSVVDGAYYYGSYANENNFKDHAKDYSILHLALHGEINNSDPMKSKLYFTQDKDSLEDNYLHAYELYNMELNAELAVLSACNTGSGKLARGEGILSLGRAFTYAGCKSLVLSQWDVSDAFTPGIMKQFYLNLKEGKTKAEALRQAKLSYLSQADNLTSNPYYWAPLVQLGDNSPLKQDKNWIWISGISSLIILIGLSIYFGKYYKR